MAHRRRRDERLNGRPPYGALLATVVFVLMVAAWVASRWYYFDLRVGTAYPEDGALAEIGGTFGIIVSSGFMEVGGNYRVSTWSPSGWCVSWELDSQPGRFFSNSWYFAAWGGTLVVHTPAWPVCVTWGALTAALWFRHRRRARRLGENHCARCGYDLTGNVSGRCPECGQTIALRQRAALQNDASCQKCRPGVK